MRPVPALCLLALASACSTTRSEVAPAGDAAVAQAQFERMQSLVGTWQGQAGDGHESFPAEVTYRLTGNGSVVEETLFPGTEHEMITMYHRDGPWLVLTHYCALGNQPHMRAAQGGGTVAPARVDFTCTGASNLASHDAMHMHAASYEFVGPDHILGTWTSYEGGKPGHTAHFDLRRAQP